MDKFSKKTSKALILRGLFYLVGGIAAAFLNLGPGGEAMKLVSVICILSGGTITVSAFGHKKKEQVWYFAAVWGILELALGIYLMAFEPDYEFFVNLMGILGIMTGLFTLTISFNARKKQNFLYLVAILNAAWGFGVSSFYPMISDFFGLVLIGYFIIMGLLSIYGGLLYQSVQEKMARKKMNR